MNGFLTKTAWGLTALALLCGCEIRTAPVHTPVTVRVCRVQQAGETASHHYVGRVESAQTALITLSYGGTLDSFALRTGQRVTAGQVLAAVQSESVTSAYDMASATLRQAEDGYDRARKASEGGGVTEVQLMEVETQLAKARAAEKTARQALDKLRPKAPFDAVVEEVFQEQGVEAAALSPLCRLMDLNRLEIHFSVPESEMAQLQEQTVARVEVPALPATAQGVVLSKGISANALSHSYECVLGQLSEMPGLLPGMVCKVDILQPGTASVTVPVQAVQSDLEGRYVWTVNAQSRVEKHRVLVDGFSGRNVVVTEGLEAGDWVVTDGSRKISTGMTVNVLD